MSGLLLFFRLTVDNKHPHIRADVQAAVFGFLFYFLQNVWRQEHVYAFRIGLTFG